MSEKVNYNLYVMILDQEQYERIKKLMREHANWDDEAEREIEKDLQNADLVDFEGKVKCAFHLNLLLADQISREEFVKNEGFPKWILEHMFDFIDEGFTLYIDKF